MPLRRLAQCGTICAALALGAAWPAAHAQNKPTTSHVDMGLDVSFISASGHPSWLEGSGGKLRYDDDTEGLQLSRGFIEYEALITDSIKAHIVSELYDDDFGPTIDLTEAYLEWRPVPGSATRYRLKAGAFYPRISFENVGPGWSSPYSISPSAINTWVGEELRAVGLELSVSRRLQSFGGAHKVTLNAAVFGGNDPAGGLIAWKGWSIHDRQSRFNDRVPLPPVPRIQPGEWFDEQDPYITPLLEIDEEPGFYINAEWQYGKKLLVRAMHYDNRANPQGIEDNQFAWWTRFDHVGLQTTLPGDIGLLAQWMEGWTAWGRYDDGVWSIDTDFMSQYLLLTRAFDRHRVTARYDHFEMTENDQTPLDENSEHGHAWTLSYQYQASKNISLAAEWLQIFTDRAAFEYYGLERRKTETQVQFALRLRFGRSH